MVGSLAVVLLVAMILTGCALLDRRSDAPAARHLGGQTDLGKGTVSRYAELNRHGEPTAIGVVFSPTALEGFARRRLRKWQFVRQA